MADKSAHKERTRARILDEAAQALRSHGTEGVSVAALMKRAGLTHGGFYAHFASRDDLVAHAIDRMFEDSGRLLDQFLGKEPDAAGLNALIDYYLSEQSLDARERACPIPGLAGEAHRMPPAARARFEQGIEDFRQGIAEALETTGQSDADKLATSVLAEMIGAMALARSLSDRETALQILAASRERIKQRAGGLGSAGGAVR